MSRLKWFVLGAMIAFTTSCSSGFVKIDVPEAVPPTLGQSRQINSEDCGYLFLYVFHFGINSRLEDAYLDLRLEASGDYFTDVKISESWEYGFFGTTFCTELTATAYKTNAKKIESN